MKKVSRSRLAHRKAQIQKRYAAQFLTDKPPWWLISTADFAALSGYSSTYPMVLRSRGLMPDFAPREWTKNIMKYMFVHDYNNLFRQMISFPDDCRDYLSKHTGPPGVFSEDADILTRILTLEAGEFFGPPGIPFRLDRHEDWLDTIAIRLHDVEVNTNFSLWRLRP